VRLKAMEAGNMIGFVAGDPRPANGTAWIATIAVLPAFRRKGVGTGLLRACEAALPGERLRLSVRASNEDATRLYEREGYERTEIWQAYYRDGEAAIIMEKLRAK
jgi:ribosomal-protein-alanine N-acetyltransferase